MSKSAAQYLQMVPVPPPADINTGRSPLHQATMMELIGAPGPLTRNCSTPTNPRLVKAINSQIVPGKNFRLTGYGRSVTIILAVLAQVEKADPVLYSLIGNDGMLCCRAVRGSASSYSNHSWGMAWDMQIGGNLVEYGARECQAGLVELYRYFHAARYYWGAGFPTPDAMHWEPSDELVREWFGVKAPA